MSEAQQLVKKHQELKKQVRQLRQREKQHLDDMLAAKLAKKSPTRQDSNISDT